MKKITKLLGLTTIMLMLAGCSDDEIVNGVKGEHGGFVYNGFTQQEIDESDQRPSGDSPFWRYCRHSVRRRI